MFYVTTSRYQPGLACLVLLFGLVAAMNATAQSMDATEYQVKAAFIYKFCLYVEWPANAFPDAGGPIILGVVGPEDLVQDLREATRNHTMNGRVITIRRVINDADSVGLHLLFISKSEISRIPKLIAQARGHPTLLITESPDGLDAGSTINFTVQERRVRFDVGLDAAAQQGLRMSAQLLQVARSVRGGDTR